ncbi:MAG: polysaccharide deacetylase family protein [Rubrivivax sp.]|nr:polysaccharide deacetylase family protein [Rubrivivax sp.]
MPDVLLHPTPPRWPWPPALAASVGVHALAAAGVLVDPAQGATALAAVALNQLVLTAAGLWPRSTLLGPNWRRLPAAAAQRAQVALTFDDGPDPEVTPRVLDMLDAAGARATFFVIGRRAQAAPALTREIVARGHALGNHSAVHRHHFALLGPGGFAREIGRAQQILADVAGVRAHCFRAPAGLRNPLLDPVLHRLGLQLVSWTRRGLDTRDGDAARVHARLVRGLAAGDILLLHDGHAARTPSGRPVVLAVLPPLLSALRAAGLATVTLAEAVPLRYPLP